MCHFSNSEPVAFLPFLDWPPCTFENSLLNSSTACKSLLLKDNPPWCHTGVPTWGQHAHGHTLPSKTENILGTYRPRGSRIALQLPAAPTTAIPSCKSEFLDAFIQKDWHTLRVVSLGEWQTYPKTQLFSVLTHLHQEASVWAINSQEPALFLWCHNIRTCQKATPGICWVWEDDQ